MKKELEETLTAKSIHPTAVRLIVLDYLTKQDVAVSLTDAEENIGTLDRITLYRTLKTFEEKGLVHSIAEGVKTKYALCGNSCGESGHHDTHIHFYCNQCKETICLPKSRIAEPSLPVRFQAQEISLTVKGICNKCNSIALS